MATEGIKAKDLPIVSTIDNNDYIMAITDMTENNLVRNISKGDFISGVVSEDANNDLEIGTDGRLLIKDKNLIDEEPTGFKHDITTTYNSTARTFTLTGLVEAYSEGKRVEALFDGYVTPPHPDEDGTYYVYYNIDTEQLIISTTPWDFKHILIAIAEYHSFKFGVRETHGLKMDADTHGNIHLLLGTARISGGDLSDYVLDSTDEEERRPDVGGTVLLDEDLYTTIPFLNTKEYSQFYLSSTGDRNIDTDMSDIVPLAASIPYYNEWTGSVWQQTQMGDDTYQALFLLAIPTTADENSQKYRYLWIQGQSAQDTLSAARAIEPNNINLGAIGYLASEYVFLKRIVIHYVSSDWSIAAVDDLTGTRVSQSSVAVQGSYLSFVNTGYGLLGNGTAGSPLEVDKKILNTPFSVNSGNIDSNGDSDLVSYSSGTLSFKVGTTYPNLVVTPANSQPTFTRTSIADLDMSGYADGTYNIFVGKSGEVIPLANTIYAQCNKPLISNVTIAGTLANNDAVLSGFSASNYAKTPTGFAASASSCEFFAKIKTGSDVTTNQTVYGSVQGSHGLQIHFYSAKWGLHISSVTSSWNIVDAYGTYTVLPNTEYYIRVKFTGTTYSLEYSLDNENWTTDITVSSSVKMLSTISQFYIGLYYNKTVPMTSGSIDLKESYIKTNGSLWWKGYTEHVWLDTSCEPLTAKKYNGTEWESFNDVPLGQITIASGVITSVETFDFNQNGYNLNIYSPVLNVIPDYTKGVSLSVGGTTNTIEKNGWIVMNVGSASSTAAYAYINDIQVGRTLNAPGSYEARFSITAMVSKDDKVRISTTNGYITFYPMKGVN